MNKIWFKLYYHFCTTIFEVMWCTRCWHIGLKKAKSTPNIKPDCSQDILHESISEPQLTRSAPWASHTSYFTLMTNFPLLCMVPAHCLLLFKQLTKDLHNNYWLTWMLEWDTRPAQLSHWSCSKGSSMLTIGKILLQFWYIWLNSCGKKTCGGPSLFNPLKSKSYFPFLKTSFWLLDGSINF